MDLCSAVNRRANRRCRLMGDALFFKSRISRIDGSGDLGEQIVKVVQEKTVQTAPVPVTVPEPSMAPTGAGGEKEAEEPSPGKEPQEAAAEDKEEETKV